MPTIAYQAVPKLFLVINTIVATIYLAWWLVPGRAGNPILFTLLLAGEIYHVFMALTFWQTVWPARGKNTAFDKNHFPAVDVFITVAGEPKELVQQTALAAKNMSYPNFKVFILNDSYAAKKPNWQDIEELTNELSLECITRNTNQGAKAGNINNALKKTWGEIVVIFDSDMIPHPDFLEKTIPYFADPQVGFVQSPQYYKNFQASPIAIGAWEQQAFFYGPIMRGKEKDNAAFVCGTNVAIRRTALEEVGGMAENNITEDFLTSIYIHQKGYISYYVPEILAEGLAPEDMGSYFKQQLRWARGQFDVIFRQNILFKKGLSVRQKIQYFSSALFYLKGPVIFIDMMMPVIFLFSGLEPVTSTTTSFAVFFVPFMFLNLYTLYLASNASLTFRAISFSQSSWITDLLAMISVLSGRKMSFNVTPKSAQKGNHLVLVLPHLIYIFVACGGIVVAIMRQGLDPAVSTNIAWAIFNMVMFIPFIQAADA